MPINLDPTEAANTARDASQYWVVMRGVWPIALVGGCVGVIMHLPEIINSKGWLKKAAMVGSEWTAGATTAIAVSLLLPIAVLMCPVAETVVLNANAELGLCSFIGGSLGRGFFRWVARRIFGYDTRKDGKETE